MAIDERCPACGEPRGTGKKCRACHGQVDPAPFEGPEPAEAPPGLVLSRAPELGPYRGHVTRFPQLGVEWRWRKTTTPTTLGFLGTLAAIGGALWFAAGYLPWILEIGFQGLAILLWFFVTGYLVTLAVERTRIAIEGDALIAEHRPLPAGNHRLAAAEVTGVHVARRELVDAPDPERRHHEYWLMADTRDGARHHLATLERPEDALYLRRVLRDALSLRRS